VGKSISFLSPTRKGKGTKKKKQKNEKKKREWLDNPFSHRGRKEERENSLLLYEKENVGPFSAAGRKGRGARTMISCSRGEGEVVKHRKSQILLVASEGKRKQVIAFLTAPRTCRNEKRKKKDWRTHEGGKKKNRRLSFS